MPRFLTPLLACLPLLSWAAAEGTATLSGRVLAAAGDSPIADGYVSLHTTSGDVAVSASATDAEGRFTLRALPVGQYRLTVTGSGLERQTLAILIGDKNNIYTVGDVRLETQTLEEVQVSGERQISSIERRVYALENNVAQSTGSILDAMKSLPGVTVDSEGKVLLRGSDRVTILIDGKPSGITGFGDQRGLDSISATNAASIEVINNPSARYDAAGMAGVINITYKKETTYGWTGDFSTAVAVGQLTRSKADLPTDLGSFTHNPKFTPSLNLNYNDDNKRAFFQMEYQWQRDLPNNEFHTRRYDDGRVILSQVPENRKQYHYIVKAGLDWTPSSGNPFSVAAIHDFESHMDRAQVPFIDAATGQRNRFWFWREEEDTGFTNISVNQKWLFAEQGHSLNLRLEYTRGLEDESYFLNEVSTVRTGTDFTHIVADENTLPLSLDYVRPLRFGRLETGVKYQRRWIPVTYDVTRGVGSVIYPGLGDYSDWDEGIYSGYVNIVRESERLDIEAGLRVEHAEVAYTIPPENIYYPGSDSYNYSELYPSIKLTWPVGDGDKMIAAYNRRVDRPGEPQLRIFAKYDDPELLKVGNPYLRPQFTDVFELGYQHGWSAGSVSLSAYHRQIDDAFIRIFAIDNTNPSYAILNKIFHNVGKSQQTGLELIATQDIGSRWDLSGSLNGYQNKVDAYRSLLYFPTTRPLDIAASKSTTWDIKLNSQWRLAGDTLLQASYVRYAARNVTQGRELPRSALDLAVKRPIFGNRGEISASFTDVFNTFGFRHEAEGNGFVALYENLFETQVLSVAMKYRF